MSDPRGWRHRGEAGCGAEWDAPVMVQMPEGYSKPIGSRRVRCERPKGHTGWHCCDQASWAPTEAA